MDSKAPEIKRMLRAIPMLDLRTDLTLLGGNESEAGRWDGMINYFGQCIYIEFKDHSGGLKLSGSMAWSKEQREWGIQRTTHGTRCFLSLVAGEQRPDAAKASDKPKRAWLIPQYYAEHCARLIEEMSGQKTIPYRAGKGTRKVLQRQKLDCVTLFSNHELDWANGGWKIPSDHVFMDMLTAMKRYDRDIRLEAYRYE